MKLREPLRGEVVAVDPGQGACGWAKFVDGELVAAGAARVPGPRERGARAWRALGRATIEAARPGRVGTLVVERMKVYVVGRADPDDLLELAAVGGSVVQATPWAWDVEDVLAAEWNGQVPADVRAARTREWVESNGWLDRVDLDTTVRFQKDVWSAIGIGRWAVTGR